MYAWGSMANWVTIKNAYVPSTTRSAWCGCCVDVAPAVVVLVEDVRRGARVAGTQGRVLDEAACPGRGPARWYGARAAPRTRPRRARRPPRRRRRSGRRPRQRVRRGTSSRRWRGRGGRGVAARSGASVGQIGGGRHEPNAGDLERCRHVDPAIRARAISRETSLTWRTSSWGKSATYCCSPVTRARPPTRAAGSPTLTAVPRSRPGPPIAPRPVAPRSSSRGPRHPRLPARPR